MVLYGLYAGGIGQNLDMAIVVGRSLQFPHADIGHDNVLIRRMSGATPVIEPQRKHISAHYCLRNVLLIRYV